jgi:hypothetical protein
MKLRHLFASLLLSAAIQVAPAAEPLPLKVLFVGIDPATVTLTDVQRSNALAGRGAELNKVRTAQFDQFLRQHFTTVKVVHGAAYKESMSDGYDVTIFDALPPPIRPASRPAEGSRQPTSRNRAQYLSEDFSGAAILIAEVSPGVSEPLEYKMDWLCLCLDAHAHGMKLGHPVFSTPNKVKVALEYRPTPPNYRLYFDGRTLPDKLPMLRMQKEGYIDGKGYPPGLVSGGHGFEDADDAEIIANGVNAKSKDSVALGRHGNFFHWGFSASPPDMTDEARLLFINAVHYIANFKGQRPYSKRPYRSNTREMAVDMAYMQSLAKAGVSLNVSVASMAAPAESSAKPAPPLSAEVLANVANLPYLYPAGDRGFEVDEDVRSLAVSNRDPQLLELCVAMLESGLDTGKASRILTRYTGEDFKSPQQWRQWLERSRDKLYFSDLDGYRFHVAPR